MIQYGDHVHEHENIRVRVRVRVQNPWSTQQKQSERTWLQIYVIDLDLIPTKFKKTYDGNLGILESHFLGNRLAPNSFYRCF